MSDSLPLRIALLASCTIDLIKEPLAATLSARDIAADFWIAGFGQYRQLLIDPESECYRFDPHIAILYLDAEDLFAPLLEHPLDFNKSEREELVQQCTAELADLVLPWGRIGGFVQVVDNSSPVSNRVAVAANPEQAGRIFITASNP